MRRIIIFATALVLIVGAISFAETTDPRFPGGTMGEPEGVIAVVSIFADEPGFTWDLDRKRDQQAYLNIYRYVEMAADYLTKQIARYGKKVRFVWDWDENEDLAYTVSFKTDLGKTLNDSFEGVFEADEIIKENIDTDGIIKLTGADNIVYLFFINSDGSQVSNCSSFFTGNVKESKGYCYMYERYGEKPEPYEFCFIFANEATGGVIAHEIIHTFAVPDLYGESSFGVTDELAQYLKKIKLNDIMQGTDFNKNKISEQITDITAYYMGLTDKCDLVSKFDLEPSTHTKAYTQLNKVAEADFVNVPIFDPVSGQVTFFDESSAAGGGSGDTLDSSVYTSQIMDKPIPIETGELTISDEEANGDDIFPINIEFSVKGNSGLKISAVINFDDSKMEDEEFEEPRITKTLKKITYEGVAYGMVFTVTGTKSKGSFDSHDQELMTHAYKTTGNYAITLLNVLMED